MGRSFVHTVALAVCIAGLVPVESDGGADNRHDASAGNRWWRLLVCVSGCDSTRFSLVSASGYEETLYDDPYEVTCGLGPLFADSAEHQLRYFWVADLRAGEWELRAVHPRHRSESG